MLVSQGKVTDLDTNGGYALFNRQAFSLHMKDERYEAEKTLTVKPQNILGASTHTKYKTVDLYSSGKCATSIR